MKKLIAFFKEEDGVTAIEYGLIAAGIGIAIVATVQLVGGQLISLFDEVQVALGGTTSL